MATRTWQDANNDWNSTYNWSGSTVPVSNDDVVIDYGTKDITGSLDQSAVSLNSLKIKAGYSGNIGTPASPFKIGVNGAAPTAFEVSQTGSAIYYSGTFTVELKVTNTNGGTFFLVGGSQTTSTRGLTVGPNANVQISNSFGTFAGVIANAGGGLTIFSNAYVSGVTHEFIAGNTLWNYLTASASSGALLTVGPKATVRVYGKYGTVATANVYGNYIHEATTTITTANLYPSGTIRNGGFGDFTITTQNQWQGSQSFEFAAAARTTITTRNLIGS